MKAIITALALLLAAPVQAHPAPGQDAPALEAKQVYVIRHLHKAEGDDPPLSAEGEAQARRLADLLTGSNIKAIFATPTRRARETAKPLASRLGIAIQAYDHRNPDALREAVAAAPGDVLVVGHSNTVADLVSRFGGRAPAPLGEGDYGTVWLIAHGGKETRTLSLSAMPD